jgi:hypothetical protein
MKFVSARKVKTYLRLGVVGPAGSGKTYSALAILSALLPNGRIALVDTEAGSAALYGGIFNFDALVLTDFHPRNYVDAIQLACREGYDGIILDSLSHAWAGTGGVLDLHDAAARRSKSGNTWTAWRDVTPFHNDLVDAMLQTPIHLIATMRSKVEYTQVQEDGKAKIKKLGTAAIQREGMDYEFSVILEMDLDNVGSVLKSRCPALTGKVFKNPGEQVARILRDWLDSGEDAPAIAPADAMPQEQAEFNLLANNAIDAGRMTRDRVKQILADTASNGQNDYRAASAALLQAA